MTDKAPSHRRANKRVWRMIGLVLLGIAAMEVLAACEGCSQVQAKITYFKVEPNYIECVPGTQVTFQVSYQVNPDTYTVSLEEGAPSRGPSYRGRRPAPHGAELPARQDSFQRTVPCVYGDYPVTLIAYGEVEDTNGSPLQVQTIQIRPPGTATGNPHLSSVVSPGYRLTPIA